MSISPIGSITNIPSVTAKAEVSEAPASGASFKELVKDAVSEVNKLQTQADQSAVKLATGELEDVHRAMIDMQKAKLALDLTIQVRNKVIEAYQEIMRMQV